MTTVGLEKENTASITRWLAVVTIYGSQGRERLIWLTKVDIDPQNIVTLPLT